MRKRTDQARWCSVQEQPGKFQPGRKHGMGGRSSKSRSTLCGRSEKGWVACPPLPSTLLPIVSRAVFLLSPGSRG
eukprot:3001804-Prorocentrum_lima.AAC.1